MKALCILYKEIPSSLYEYSHREKRYRRAVGNFLWNVKKDRLWCGACFLNVVKQNVLLFLSSFWRAELLYVSRSLGDIKVLLQEKSRRLFIFYKLLIFFKVRESLSQARGWPFQDPDHAWHFPSIASWPPATFRGCSIASSVITCLLPLITRNYIIMVLPA